MFDRKGVILPTIYPRLSGVDVGSGAGRVSFPTTIDPSGTMNARDPLSDAIRPTLRLSSSELKCIANLGPHAGFWPLEIFTVTVED